MSPSHRLVDDPPAFAPDPAPAAVPDVDAAGPHAASRWERTPPRGPVLRWRPALLAVTVLLVAAVFAAASLRGAVKEVSQAVAPTATRSTGPKRPATPAPSPSTAAASATSSAPAASGIEFTDVRALDPQGDGTENNGGAAKATDGDPSTFWQSEGYKREDYQGQKSGVGLALRLPRDAEPSTVSITLGDGPQDVEVYLSPTRSIRSATKIGELSEATGTQDVDVPEDARDARYVLVWVTKAMEQPDGRYRAIVSEVTAR